MAEGRLDRRDRARHRPGTGPAARRDGRQGQHLEIEERLRIGKREVGHGRVRIRSYVVGTLVEAQVTLREEQVQVERRPADRPLSGTEAAFGERMIAATERAEEAFFAKEAQVKEEVSRRRTAEERTRTVRDTVRHTEVEVDDGSKSGAARTARPADRERARDL